MPDLWAGLLHLAPWALVVAAIGVLAWALRRWHTEHTHKAELLQHLCSLHSDERATLARFVYAERHTMVLS